ncbi:MAG: bifunctional [glutamine synthetase] adenylyltransferase/[glutamine synthetase]-adenylyl-L-tyrosine phosphorylase [Hyphomicrobiales bacterium]|nr:bifunctional [glutamine synthetase] adenylyltransferase/[glutamine synthetase]-adenylyl-L-tyrosine phosphorylase [Hyphomicrobiales bacterium]
MRLADQIKTAPLVHDAEMAERNMRSFRKRLESLKNSAIAEAFGAIIAAGNPVNALVSGIFGCSPFLSRLIIADPEELWNALDGEPSVYLQQSADAVDAAIGGARRSDDAMKALREGKKRLAVATALADLGGVWTVDQVTDALSVGADRLVASAIQYLLSQTAEQGKFVPSDPRAAAKDSGYIVLGMGKYGAFELNYSSDIDLIVFYDPHKAPLPDNVEMNPFFVRLTRDLVRLLTERTPDGYVFRTDLRLRPDPGATQLALSVNAAFHYYESVGQNWERAAFIKARPIAGDIEVGQAFLRDLSPYVWRKYLDYAAIADIHAMKRQIHQHKGHATIAVEGHNLKLGRGGIREIEFFVQTQQLIAGGRQPDLRTSQTLIALKRFANHNWITHDVASEMAEAYRFLRKIEHRLQMLDDEQTHSLPAKADKFERIARFSGYETGADLSRAVRAHLEIVQRHYASLFEDVPGLSREGTQGNLVFTGDSDDPDTVRTLGEMGYSSPSGVISKVRGWHYGRYPATRTKRAREDLTEFQPQLLEALSNTTQPDLALATFDRFLSELPAGVQLFAMLRNNPELFELLAGIMGSAPRLARLVSRRPRLMDVLLDPDFLGELPRPEELKRLVNEQFRMARTYEECLDRARQFGQEQSFLIGIRILSATISGEEAGFAYCALADALIAGLKEQVEWIMERQHGAITGGAMAVLGMGKLGGQEMTANSDLDLIIIYQHEQDRESTGLKPLAPTQYYNRATQRLISSLSVPTAEGGLYEVDMRLRPSGNSGPVATSLAAFNVYQDSEAWTWEHLALTRARVIAAPDGLRQDIQETISNVLTRKRDRQKIVAEVLEMRARIVREKGTNVIWDLKQIRGGLIDLEFIAQFLQLVHAAEHPEILDQNTIRALCLLRDAGVIEAADANKLIAAAHLYGTLGQIVRLCQDGLFDPAIASQDLKALLCRAIGIEDFSRIESMLVAHQKNVAELFEKVIR